MVLRSSCALLLTFQFASLISSLINIISLLLTTFHWTKVRGIRSSVAYRATENLSRSFHVIFHLGSLGTNHISTAPPVVPDSATKYKEVTGGLRSVTPFEAPRRNPLVWGTADDSSGYPFPTPPFVSVCVCQFS